MANITEELNNPQWLEGIYQLETTDPVLGGPNGIANRQAKELAARTQYLKKKQEEDKPGAASTTEAGIVQLSSATDSNSEELAATPKAVKAAYDKAVESAGKGLPIGAVIGFPRAITSQEGFLKADGSTFAQATYPDLHRVLGGNKLPNLTSSDIGMTAYFPVADIPEGWIKYDEIATKVTQSAYPELYRKLVAQYGSIDAVPTADENLPKAIAMVLCIKAQNSLDDVVMWIKAYGKVTNAGVLDASTLAAQLQNKSDKGHTHRAAEINDFAEAVAALTVHQKIGTFDICKLPDGTQIESGTVRIQNHNNNPTARVLTWPLAFVDTPVVVATMSGPEGNVRDIWVTIDNRQSNQSAVHYWLHEPVYNTPDVTVNFVAVGRWK